MNGKSVTNKPVDFSILQTVKSAERVVSNRSEADRESSPNQYKKQKKPRKLTPEEISKALSLIENLPGFKKNNFKLIAEKANWIIVDSEGNTVRRLSVFDLVDYLENEARSESQDQKGTLLKKTI